MSPPFGGSPLAIPTQRNKFFERCEETKTAKTKKTDSGMTGVCVPAMNNCCLGISTTSCALAHKTLMHPGACNKDGMLVHLQLTRSLPGIKEGARIPAKHNGCPTPLRKLTCNMIIKFVLRNNLRLIPSTQQKKGWGLVAGGLLYRATDFGSGHALSGGLEAGV